jgi:hypothetical protein
VVKRDLGRFREALGVSAITATGPLDALRRVALRYVEIGASRDYAAFYLSVSAEAALSTPLRGRLAAWSQTALEPLAAAVCAAQMARKLRAEDPILIGTILVDLLEGANNRVRLHEDSSTGTDRHLLLFEQRWAVFLAAFGAEPGPLLVNSLGVEPARRTNPAPRGFEAS